MDSPSDKSDAVAKLVRLKRHEQPPPRYFNDFSSRVIARIERGEARVSWWERFGFDVRPAMAAATGALACGLIVYGVATAGGEGVDIGSTAPTSPMSINGLMANADASAGNSTNPVTTYGTPIDRKIFRSDVTPVMFNQR